MNGYEILDIIIAEINKVKTLIEMCKKDGIEELIVILEYGKEVLESVLEQATQERGIYKNNEEI